MSNRHALRPRRDPARRIQARRAVWRGRGIAPAARPRNRRRPLQGWNHPRHLGTFVEVGTALSEIRDSRIYRTTFKTFEDYCQKRWEFSRQYVNKIISASEVVSNLETNVSKPKTESQARPLAKLPADQQPAAWERAQEKAKEQGKPVAARHVEAEARSWTVSCGREDQAHPFLGAPIKTDRPLRRWLRLRRQERWTARSWNPSRSGPCDRWHRRSDDQTIRRWDDGTMGRSTGGGNG